ncbi:MAG: type II secretion system ATPase GspE [Rhodanobacter sp.]|jgi:general secretion pathway protein E|nr:type II secretion system ATPase GspE [Rhodanobacter sp.]
MSERAAPEPKPARPSFGYARRHGVALTLWRHGGADIACREGVRPEVLAELRRHLGVPLHFTACAPDDFDRLLRDLYEQGDDARTMVSDLDERMDLKAVADELPEPEDLLESDDDAPIIRLINALLTEAVKEGASDIHIEPYENRLVVRFRLDGVLREVLAPQKAIASAVVSRIKVMAKLNIAERRLPQDGRIGLRIAGRPVDVRVSTIPAGRGERVVLRLLDKQAGKLDLAQLGMDETLRLRLQDMIARPHGILLVTGPTGSGKTTTLYASLLKLNDTSRNIMTVEDPIEYYIDGVGQTQVNTRVDMTFARGLRAILRQDPDVVMVGEIRDLETAQIAVQASLTGHLVLSTLHTNSAAGAIARLRDMGVEPFLLASSLIGVFAQRLVRVLDPATREAYRATPAELTSFGKPAHTQATLYRPRADVVAKGGRHAGYRGRTGIYELIGVDETLRRMIHENASEADFEHAARTHCPSILEDGWRKCVAGITSTEEVLRVTRED